MDLLLTFLNKNYYLFVPALWVLGFALKQTPKVPRWSIIWILFGFSLSTATFFFGFSYHAILNGIIATGIAVLGHQLYKQTLQAISSQVRDDCIEEIREGIKEELKEEVIVEVFEEINEEMNEKREEEKNNSQHLD